MSSQDNETYDKQFLARCFLADLSRDGTEALDELSLADDEVASRLRVVENDLVDTHVRDELSPANMESFRSSYLSSSQRRQSGAPEVVGSYPFRVVLN
jgi:hypothetical protein